MQAGGEGALVDPSLLIQLDARVGDTLVLGEARFQIQGEIRKAPGSFGLQTQVAPRVFIAQQNVFLRSQENELAGLQSQLERVGNIEVDLAPMMLQMFNELEDFIASDLPFRLDQRTQRLDNIREVLGEANVSPAEKYRLLLNAFEIESAYGRSLNAYSEEVLVDGVPQEANILQIGRVAMIRQVGDDLAIMTHDNQTWRPVPSSMASNVQRAFRIANEVTTPEVFEAPLPGPTAQ